MGADPFTNDEIVGPFKFNANSPGPVFTDSGIIPTDIFWIIPLFDSEGELIDFKRSDRIYARTAMIDSKLIQAPISPFSFDNVRIKYNYQARSVYHTATTWEYTSTIYNTLVADLHYYICPGHEEVKTDHDVEIVSWSGNKDAYWDILTRRWSDEDPPWDKAIKLGLAKIIINLDLPDIGSPDLKDKGVPITFNEPDGQAPMDDPEPEPEGEPEIWNLTGIYGIKKDDDIYVRVGTKYEKLLGRELSGYDLNHMLGNKWSNFKSNHIYLIVDDSITINDASSVNYIRVDFKVREKK